MDLTGLRPTAEQRDLRDAVRGLLAREADPDKLWQRLCGEIGAAGLAIPEACGGAGAGPVETHLVMAELGRGLTPSPLLGSAVLTAGALLASGDDAACLRLLPAIAGGSAIGALAWTTGEGRWDPAEAAFEARRFTGSPGGWTLTGEAHYVLDGDVADVLVAAARTPDGIGLFGVDPGDAARCEVTSMDTTRRLAVVRLDGADGRPVGGDGSAALARARDLACIALAAEQAGAAGRALELTVAYSKERVQFGRPIGGFQALQHRMADMHLLVESARALSFAAASAAAEGAADLPLQAAAAKAFCSEALLTVAGEMIQLHGAIGVTWEHDAHRYLKRAHGAAHLLGPPAAHIARIAGAVLDNDEEPEVAR
jgi:hypothetical protein